MDHPSRRSYYDPLCPFPYINEGWILPLNNQTSDIKFGTEHCTLRISDASSRYNTVYLIYFILASIPIPIFVFYLKKVDDNKDDKKKSKVSERSERKNKAAQARLAPKSTSRAAFVVKLTISFFLENFARLI